MEKRLRTNLVLVAAVIALGLFIRFAPDPQDVPQARLFDAADEPSPIEVFHAGELHFRLQADGGNWNVVAPFELPADEFQVNALLDALRKPVARRYPVEELEPAAAGLAGAEWTMRIAGAELALGGRTAVDNLRYLRKDRHVYLVPETLVFRLQRSPYDYVGKRLLPEDVEMRGIRLPSGQRIGKSGSGWQITPENESVSADDLQGLVDAWKNATAMKVGAAHSVPRGGEAVIEFEDGEILRFGVERRDDALLLSRADPAVTYTLPAHAADRLLRIVTAEPAAAGIRE